MACKFSQAIESFDAAIEILEREYFVGVNDLASLDRDKFLLALPWATLAAFQIELCLKTILTKYNLDVPRIHKLEKLFKLIPQDIRNEVKAKLSRYDFDKELAKVHNVFIESRYLAESEYSPVFLKQFRSAILEVDVIRDSKKIKIHRFINGCWQLVQ